MLYRKALTPGQDEDLVGKMETVKITLGGETMPEQQLAKAILACFISPNVCDSNLEPANFVDVVHHLAISLHELSEAIHHLARVTDVVAHE